MAIINTRVINDIRTLKTYRAPKGNYSYVLTTPIPGRGESKLILNCDKFDRPKNIVDIRPGKFNSKEVYTKAQDGSVVLQKGDEKFNLSYISFSTLLENFLK